jgi:hypothetical protein
LLKTTVPIGTGNNLVIDAHVEICDDERHVMPTPHPRPTASSTIEANCHR